MMKPAMPVRHVRLKGFVVAVLLACGFSSAVAEDFFPDDNLEAVIRQILRKKENEQIKEEELRDVYILKARGRQIENLAGLEKLSSLYLDGNQIRDIKPLENLRWLSSLDLHGNQVENLSPLANLTELRYTMLQGNKITDLAVLVEMARRDVEGEKRFAPYWHVFLKDNPLSEEAKSKQVAALREMNVRVDLER